jgi:hypothetical protein
VSLVILAIALVGALAPFTMAQQAAHVPIGTEALLTLPESPGLPDSPGTVLVSSSSATPEEAAAAGGQAAVPSKPMAIAHVKFVSANQPVPTQTAGDKVILGLRESVTPFSMIGWVFSAGWAQLIDGSPNYGTNGKAFSQRLGAAAALSSSREIFSDSILAPLFHQDPRYYQLGHGHKFINRAIYAGTRTIIGKTDSGRTIPNYAFILGTAGAAGLTTTYYPEKNQSGSQVALTFGSSLGGSAVGYLISEFGGEVIQWLHITKHE